MSPNNYMFPRSFVLTLSNSYHEPCHYTCIRNLASYMFKVAQNYSCMALQKLNACFSKSTTNNFLIEIYKG